MPKQKTITEKFNKEFKNNFDVSLKKDIKQFYAKEISNLKDVPMGISEWRNYGIKYGYAMFFQEEEISKLLEDIIGESLKVKNPYHCSCGAKITGDEMDCMHCPNQDKEEDIYNKKYKRITKDNIDEYISIQNKHEYCWSWDEHLISKKRQEIIDIINKSPFKDLIK